MKKNFAPLVFLLFVGVVCYIGYRVILYEDNTGVNVGQIWASETNNPFSKTYEYYILEIRGDWVKYVNVIYSGRGDTDDFAWSDKIWWFKKGKYLKEVK